MSRFSPEPYKSDGGFSLAGLPVLFFILFVAAGALGWLASFIGQWFYLILLFPVGIGLGLVLVGGFVGKLTKMRSVGIAILTGLMAGAVAIVSMHYFDYLRFRARADQPPAGLKLPAGVDAAQFKQLVQALHKAKGVDTFLGYMKQQATEGVRIGRRGGGFNLGYTGSWIYWGLELVGVAVLAMLGLVGSASAPYCRHCEKWKESRPLGTLVGPPVEVKGHLEEGNLKALHRYASGEDGELHVSAHVCPGCGAEGDIAVKLEQVSKNAKGEESRSELTHLAYPGQALAELEAVFTAPEEDEEETLDAMAVEPVEDDEDRPRRR